MQHRSNCPTLCVWPSPGYIPEGPSGHVKSYMDFYYHYSGAIALTCLDTSQGWVKGSRWSQFSSSLFPEWSRKSQIVLGKSPSSWVNPQFHVWNIPVLQEKKTSSGQHDYIKIMGKTRRRWHLFQTPSCWSKAVSSPSKSEPATPMVLWGIPQAPNTQISMRLQMWPMEMHVTCQSLVLFNPGTKLSWKKQGGSNDLISNQ